MKNPKVEQQEVNFGMKKVNRKQWEQGKVSHIDQVKSTAIMKIEDKQSWKGRESNQLKQKELLW